MSALAAATAALAPAAASAQAPEVLARGLDNPRGIVVDPRGGLYVAEAGRAGSRCAGRGERQICFGLTGAVTRIADGRVRRVARNLPSVGARNGAAATGPHDVAVRGNNQVWIAMGFGNELSARRQAGPAGRNLGTLLRLMRSGKVRRAADLAAFEARVNPDKGRTFMGEPGLNANPYSVIAQNSRRVVVDAGGNSVLSVDGRGRVRTLAVLPPRLVPAPEGFGIPAGTEIPMQSVPTAVTQSVDGTIYVGQLTGFPFPVGGANVYAITPGGEPRVVAGGFSGIVDIAVGPANSLYVLEFGANGVLAAEQSPEPSGRLTRIAADGTRSVVADKLPVPGGVAVDLNGNAYVTVASVLPRQGQVLRFAPTPAG